MYSPLMHFVPVETLITLASFTSVPEKQTRHYSSEGTGTRAYLCSRGLRAFSATSLPGCEPTTRPIFTRTPAPTSYRGSPGLRKALPAEDSLCNVSGEPTSLPL